MQKDGKSTGIEITKIYAGNDWVPEKIREDIKMYNIDKKYIPRYIELKKYNNKIFTYKIRENLIIRPIIRDDVKELEVKVKNKILEKIRKMFDDYRNYDTNVILASIVTSEYFHNIENFNKELRFFIEHLEVNKNGKSYILFIKTKHKLVKFNLNDYSCEVL